MAVRPNLSIDTALVVVIAAFFLRVDSRRGMLPLVSEVVRELEIPPTLKRRLLHLRAISGTALPAVLDVDVVTELEASLKTQLGDCFLALLANQDGLLDEFDIRPRNVATMTEDFHKQGMPRGMLGLGRSADGNTLVGCPPMGRIVHLMNVEEGTTRQLPIEQWLDELVAAARDSVRDDDGEAKARAHHTMSEKELEEFALTLIRRPKADAKRVHHPKFGDGDVISESGNGEKFEIRFDDGSTRNLLSRFVTVTSVPEPPAAESSDTSEPAT